MIAHKGLQFQGFLIIPFWEKKREFWVLTLVLSLVSLHPCFLFFNNSRRAGMTPIIQYKPCPFFTTGITLTLGWLP
jgi:hypothetical protein